MASADDAAKIIKEGFSERLKNPFIVSFALAWVAINWKFLWLFWVDGDFKDAEFNTTQVALDSAAADIARMVWFPLASSVAYVILSPWLKLGAEWVQGRGLLMARTRKISHQILIAERQLQLRLAEHRATEKVAELADLEIRERKQKVEDLEQRGKVLDERATVLDQQAKKLEALAKGLDLREPEEQESAQSEWAGVRATSAEIEGWTSEQKAKVKKNATKKKVKKTAKKKVKKTAKKKVKK